MRPPPVGAERGVGLLEHDRHDVVADVPLPLELLEVCLGEVDEGADGVHDLLAAVLRVDALLPRLAKLSRLTQCPIISRNLSSAGEWPRLPNSASSLVCPARW